MSNLNTVCTIDAICCLHARSHSPSVCPLTHADRRISPYSPFANWPGRHVRTIAHTISCGCCWLFWFLEKSFLAISCHIRSDKLHHRSVVVDAYVFESKCFLKFTVAALCTRAGLILRLHRRAWAFIESIFILKQLISSKIEINFIRQWVHGHYCISFNSHFCLFLSFWPTHIDPIAGDRWQCKRINSKKKKKHISIWFSDSFPLFKVRWQRTGLMPFSVVRFSCLFVGLCWRCFVIDRNKRFGRTVFDQLRWAHTTYGRVQLRCVVSCGGIATETPTPTRMQRCTLIK